MAMAQLSENPHMAAAAAAAASKGYAGSPSPFPRNSSSSSPDFASKYLMETAAAAAAAYASSDWTSEQQQQPHFHQNAQNQQHFHQNSHLGGSEVVSDWPNGQFVDPSSYSASSTGNAEVRRTISSFSPGIERKNSWQQQAAAPPPLASSNGGLSLTVDPSKGGLALQGMAFADFPADPGFVERAARYSSFNGAYSPNKQQLSRTSSFSGNVAPTPHEDVLGDQEGKFFSKLHKEASGVGGFNSPSKEDSLGSAQNSVEQAPNPQGSSRKRKNASGEERSKEHRKDSKKAESEDTKAKRQKGSDSKEKDEAKGKADRSCSENSGSSSPKSAKDNAKPPEAPKQDYIHVRARRGQATDSHSLAERVRREKISERMKFLQDLVPGCSKVTGKAVMLDEIINYVQSLQRQVEFLSMKLAAVNPRLDLNLEGLLAKEVLHGRSVSSSPLTLSHEMPANYSHLQQQLQHAQQAVMQLGSCGLDLRSLGNSLETSGRTPSGIVSSEAFADATSQLSSIWDGDLHSVVQMFGLPATGGRMTPPHDLTQGHLPVGHMKVEI